jgi:hypothetical protein
VESRSAGLEGYRVGTRRRNRRLRALVIRVPMPVVVPAEIIQRINVKGAFAMGIERYGDAMLKLAKKEEGNG